MSDASIGGMRSSCCTTPALGGRLAGTAQVHKAQCMPTKPNVCLGPGVDQVVTAGCSCVTLWQSQPCCNRLSLQLWLCKLRQGFRLNMQMVLGYSAAKARGGGLQPIKTSRSPGSTNILLNAPHTNLGARHARHGPKPEPGVQGPRGNFSLAPPQAPQLTKLRHTTHTTISY